MSVTIECDSKASLRAVSLDTPELKETLVTFNARSYEFAWTPVESIPTLILYKMKRKQELIKATKSQPFGINSPKRFERLDRSTATSNIYERRCRKFMCQKVELKVLCCLLQVDQKHVLVEV
jgi:hypothetical protein